jgi:hypothetical protein
VYRPLRPRRHHRTQTRQRRALRVLLGGLRLELEPHDALVADDPRIVTGLDDVRLAGPDLLFRAVFVGHLHRARLQKPEVAHLTLLASDDRLDALRPSPSGLQPHPANGRSTHPNGRALWWLRDERGTVVHRERAYAGFRRDGELGQRPEARPEVSALECGAGVPGRMLRRLCACGLRAWRRCCRGASSRSHAIPKGFRRSRRSSCPRQRDPGSRARAA